MRKELSHYGKEGVSVLGRLVPAAIAFIARGALLPCVRGAFFMAAAVLLAAPAVFAQNVVYQDFYRKWHVYDPAKRPKPTESQLRREGAVVVPAATNIAFTVVFKDVVTSSGLGFDDPTRGAIRRNTVMAVLSYIDSVLTETGACEIEFENSETSGSGALAQAGPLFFVGDGFVDVFPFLHISTGTDPYGAGPDMNATVNFGYAWEDDVTTPSFSEIDLFSVLLHELTHGLGILSLSNSDGSSQLSPSKTFLKFDNDLYTGNGNKLWDTGGNFNGTSSWLTGGDGGVRFTGYYASRAYDWAYPPIYAPDPWQSGSSISHWDTSVSNAVMLPSIAVGAMRRQYLAFEIETLKDIGYDTEPFPDIAVSPASLNFGEQNVSAGPTAPLPLYVQNTGAAQLVLSGIAIAGANAADFGEQLPRAPGDAGRAKQYNANG